MSATPPAGPPAPPPPPVPSIEVVTLITGFVESFLVAIYIALVVTYSVIRKRQDGARPFYKAPLMMAALGLALFLIAHWALNIYRTLEAFYFINGGKAPVLFIVDPSQPTKAVLSALTVFAVLISDCMMVYRLWVVYSGWIPVLVVPICSVLGLFVSGTAMTVELVRFPPGGSIFASALSRWLNANISFILITNIYCTTFISYKIFKVASSSKRYAVQGGSRVWLVLGIFVECAAFFTAWSIVQLAVYLAESSMQFLFADCIPHVAGVATMMINVRIALTHTDPNASTMHSQASHPGRSIRAPTVHSGREGVAVHIQQAKHGDYPLDDMGGSFESRQKAMARDYV